MGRPTDADAEATRAKILEAALDALDTVGPNVSLRDIARRAGVSVTIVHRYFGGRAGLVETCIDTYYDDWRLLAETLEREVIGGRAVQDVLDEAVRSAFRLVRRHRAIVRMFYRGVSERGELPPERRATHEAVLGRLAKLLSQGSAVPLPELRLRVQSVIALVTRYGLGSHIELAGVLGAEDASPADAERALLDHLVGVATLLLAA